MREDLKRQRFEALVRPELDALYRTSWRIVGQRAIAEEIVQEACLRAFANFDAAGGPIAFRPWLFRVAVNLAIDHLRRGKREATSSHDDVAASHAITDQTLAGEPHVAAVGRQIGRSLDHALAALSTDHRAVVVLVLIEELSYREAAAVLAVTEDLVRSRLSRARADLRRHLAQHGADLKAQTSEAPASCVKATASMKSRASTVSSTTSTPTSPTSHTGTAKRGVQ